MRKINVLNANTAFIGDQHTYDMPPCCGLEGYYADIYYNADEKMPSYDTIKLATKKVIERRLEEVKSKRPNLRFYLSIYKDKEQGRKEYYDSLRGHKESIKRCKDLLKKLEQY